MIWESGNLMRVHWSKYDSRIRERETMRTVSWFHAVAGIPGKSCVRGILESCVRGILEC